MIEGTISYNTGLIYDIKVELDDAKIEKTLRTIFGDSYSDMKKQMLMKSISNAVTVGNPVVKKKWTNLKKESTAQEDLKWKKQTEEYKNNTSIEEVEYI